MLDYLEQLRKKPPAARKRIALLSSVALTSVIVVIWISTLNFGGTDIGDTRTISANLAPFAEIKNSVADFFVSVKEMGAILFSSGQASSDTGSSTAKTGE